MEAEMMLFVYVPERNIYFVSTEEADNLCLSESV